MGDTALSRSSSIPRPAVGVTESDERRLRRYNAVMGGMHLAQAIAILVLSSDATLPVTTSFLQEAPTPEYVPPTVNEFDLRLGPAVAIFSFLSAIAHFTLVLPGVFGWYVANLRRGINEARWYEYSLSASVMIVLIAMLTGIYDLISLILLFAVNAAMIFFGLVMERHNQTTDRTDWTAFVLGCVVGAVPWIAITISFVGTEQARPGQQIPTFVYWIFVSLFVFFNSFAINMFLQYKKIGPWHNYLFGEKAYIILSLTAKSALAWQVFAGTLR